MTTLKDFIAAERQAAERMEPSPGTAVALLLDRLQELETLHSFNCAMHEADKEELEMATDLLADNAGQFLMEHTDGSLHHSFMSVEEATCDFLVRVGRLEQVGRASYRWVK